LISHSLPGVRQSESFDAAVLSRLLTARDMSPGGDAYNMVWGRRHTDEVARRLGDAMNVRLFITGHQPAEFGHYVEGERILVIASDHDHGVLLPINLARTYTMEQLVGSLVPLASLPRE